jgi:alkane 1-monooxygenase
MGITTGGIGITVAHELCHKQKIIEKTLGKILLLTVRCMHFYTEHLIGYRVNVCTAKEPITPCLGESFYSFCLRTVIRSFRRAWKIAIGKLLRKEYSEWSCQNKMRWFVILPILFAGALGIIFGWKTIPYFFGKALSPFLS